MAYNNNFNNSQNPNEPASYRTDHIGQGFNDGGCEAPHNNTMPLPGGGRSAAGPGGAQVLTGHPNPHGIINDGTTGYPNLGHQDGANYTGPSATNRHQTAAIPSVAPGPTRGAMPSTESMGTGARLTGKVEYAIGSALGSDTMKEKGLEKQRQATLAKAQGVEHQMERAHQEHRERVLPHGTQPDNGQFVGGGGLGPL